MDSFAIVISAAQISAALALLVGVMTAIGQGKVAAAAIEAMARQPESAGQVRSTMIISLAMAETAGLYGLLISIVLIFANPLVSLYLANAIR